jgi:toxin secretion/phage lysis holin
LTELMHFFRELIPGRTQIEWGAVVSTAGTAFSYVCGWDGMLEALVFAMVIDYISGVLAAYINPHMALNSQRGFRGICKKIMILLLVSLAHFMDQAMGAQIVHSAVIWFFFGNEGLSIIENAAKAGIPIPAKLRDTLEQLSSEKMKGGESRGK